MCLLSAGVSAEMPDDFVLRCGDLEFRTSDFQVRSFVAVIFLHLFATQYFIGRPQCVL
jgi:hypothetical protein